MRGKRLLCVALASLLCAAFVVPGHAGAKTDLARRPSTDVVEVMGEYSTLGVDPVQHRLEMSETYSRLQSERASVPVTPGISIRLTEQDRIDIGEGTCEDCDGRLLLRPTRMRVGVVKAVPETLVFENLGPRTLSRAMTFHRGGLREIPGGFVWTLAIESVDAQALRIHLTEFDLPRGAELYVFNDFGEAYGPYVRQGLYGDGDFWTDSLSGSVAYLQLRYTGSLDRGLLRSIHFEIPQVAHLGAHALNENPGDLGAETVSPTAFCSFNESCTENANCSTLPAAIEQARDGIAHMQWISGAFIYICTGGLLADTDASTQVPLFLTANHCLSRGKDARNLETFWQFETSCGGACPQPFQDPPGVTKLVGAKILKTASTSDYTLMELNQNPPAGSFFIGWNNADVANSNGTALHRISHPGGAPQAYSTHSVDTSAPTCLNTSRGDWIYSRDTFGATEGGSSGSPVMNDSGQVVGQLTGACGTNTGDPCDSASNATIDGALAAYFADVAQWLDPASGGGDPPGGSCNGNGVCESGEDCTSCSADCEGRTNGQPSGRFCCGDGIAQGAEGNGSICDGNF